MAHTSLNTLQAMQACLRHHLVAVEAYQVASKHLARWGYKRLADRFASEAEGERVHMRALLERLEMLDCQPELQHDSPSWPRFDARGMLEAALRLEKEAVELERQGILVARQDGDELTALVFAELLQDSEESVVRLTADLGLIATLGIENWLHGQTQ